MGTQVTYKGSQLTSFTNDTRILKTAGKYMEDDVTIVDDAGEASAIVITDETDSHGGTIRHINAVTLTGDTVVPEVLLFGYTAHSGTGATIVGTYTPPATPVLGTKTITANGTYNASDDSLDGYSSVTVTIGTNYQDKTGITPTESTQTITADTGYNALHSVEVSGITPTYVGSGVARNTSSNLSVSGPTVTAPAGYYTSSASASVSSMSLPSSASSSSSGTSKATISRSTSDQYINIPTGYNESAAYYKVSAVANGSATAAASISATGASVSTGNNTLTLSKTVSNTPQVTAGYISSGTAGNSSVSLTASVTTQAAQTLYPSTSDQTISSGRYLTGTQTVKAVAVSNNLTADNIKSGVTVTIGDSADADRIMSVTGTYSGGGGSSKAFQIDNTNHRVQTNTYTDTGAYLKVAKAGKYDIYWSAFRSSTSSGTNGTQWYKNDVAQGSAYTTWSNSYCQNPHVSGVTLALNDEIKIYARASSNSRYCCVENLMIIEVD